MERKIKGPCIVFVGAKSATPQEEKNDSSAWMERVKLLAPLLTLTRRWRILSYWSLCSRICRSMKSTQWAASKFGMSVSTRRPNPAQFPTNIVTHGICTSDLTDNARRGVFGSPAAWRGCGPERHPAPDRPSCSSTGCLGAWLAAARRILAQPVQWTGRRWTSCWRIPRPYLCLAGVDDKTQGCLSAAPLTYFRAKVPAILHTYSRVD